MANNSLLLNPPPPPPGTPRLRRWAGTTLLLGSLALPVAAQTITVYSSVSLPISGSRQLTAYVPLSPNTVVWAVNGIPGGNSTLGTVSSTGLYTAPAVVPQPSNVVAVTARSTAYPDKVGSANITVTQVQPRLWSTRPTSVPVGAYSLTLNGAAFGTDVKVLVAGMPASTTRLSATQIMATGTAPASWAGTSQTVQVLALGPGSIGSDIVRVSFTTAAPAPAPAPSPSPSPSPAPSPTPAPPPAPAPTPAPPPAPAPIPPGTGTANLAAARLLDQAAFGPNAASVARVRQLGVEAWLNEQFLTPETPVTTGSDRRVVAQGYLHRLTEAPDQLRQRVAYALAQLLVISFNKNIYPDEVVPHLRTLSAHAFGNYRQLLEQVTRSPQMGKYLDLANSNKPMNGSAANENFARELLQLFSIGLVRLNPDGTPQLDASGRPVPTYDQATIQQVALALTGWTYLGAGTNNWENFSGPLVLREINHDPREKRFLGCVLPAGQGADADLRATLDCVFNHPNTGPFVAQRLIRQLVKSNPSPDYVRRVAQVFNNNGSGIRGDLRATVRAILVDPEARNDLAGLNDGRLRDPMQHVAATARALGGGFLPTNAVTWELSLMAQEPLTPPSVFGFYSPLFRLPQTTLSAPEFQIYTPTEATLRGNLLWQMLVQPGANWRIDLSPYQAVAGNTTALVDAVDQNLLWGRMPQAMRQSLANAINAQPDAQQRVLTAIYLTLLSGQHAVQH